MFSHVFMVSYRRHFWGEFAQFIVMFAKKIYNFLIINNFFTKMQHYVCIFWINLILVLIPILLFLICLIGTKNFESWHNWGDAEPEMNNGIGWNHIS